MRVLSSWTFVNLGALAAALGTLLIGTTPAKVMSDGLGWELIFPSIVGGLCWFALAIVRFAIDHHFGR